MDNLQIEYHPEAIAEARGAFLWYQERSQNATDRFWEELRLAREAVCARPDGWNPYYHGTRCYRLNRFPYWLVFLREGELLIGVAVCHLHRKPGYWADRLKS